MRDIFFMLIISFAFLSCNESTIEGGNRKKATTLTGSIVNFYEVDFVLTLNERTYSKTNSCIMQISSVSEISETTVKIHLSYEDYQNNLDIVLRSEELELSGVPYDITFDSDFKTADLRIQEEKNVDADVSIKGWMRYPPYLTRDIISYIFEADLRIEIISEDYHCIFNITKLHEIL